MTGQELDKLMATLFDNALLYHAYKRYMRDYEFIVEVHVGPSAQGTYSYLFRYCVEAEVHTSLSHDIYRRSLDDRLIDYETGKDLKGFLWGVKWSNMYPGWKRNPTSEKAALWSERLGFDFHEVVVETNAYIISLIFADLRIEKLSDRTSPGINATYIPLPPGY